MPKLCVRGLVFVYYYISLFVIFVGMDHIMGKGVLTINVGKGVSTQF